MRRFGWQPSSASTHDSAGSSSTPRTHEVSSCLGPATLPQPWVDLVCASTTCGLTTSSTSSLDLTPPTNLPERTADMAQRPVYPFCAIVGQEEMKLALILATISPDLSGVLI
eukprot:818222_1